MSMSSFENRLNRSRRAADLPPTLRHSGVLPADSVRRAQHDDSGVISATDSAARGLEGDRQVGELAWSMFGSVAAGILLYGVIGWLLDRWLGFDALFLPIGVLVGAGLGTYMVFVRSSQSAAPASTAPPGPSR